MDVSDEERELLVAVEHEAYVTYRLHLESSATVATMSCLCTMCFCNRSSSSLQISLVVRLDEVVKRSHIAIETFRADRNESKAR